MPGDGGATRHQSRERALSLLYEAQMKGETPAAVVAALVVPPDPYCAHLVEAVRAHQEVADRLVADASIGWAPERMAVIDRLVLRLATAELLDPEGPPPAVVLDEAVELAKEYSTDESGRFVNGILATVAGRLAEA
ncbi:MAG: transcription antitermination factor NusB [Acidimicrobiales bacterium]